MSLFIEHRIATGHLNLNFKANEINVTNILFDLVFIYNNNNFFFSELIQIRLFIHTCMK